MFDWLKKLLGKGKLNVTFVTADGRQGTAKCGYIGDINDVIKPDFLNSLKHEIEFEKSVSVKSFVEIAILDELNHEIHKFDCTIDGCRERQI